MSRVRLSVALALSSVAAGLVVSAINVSLTDSAGAPSTQTIDPADLSDDGSGRAVAVIEFPDVAVGDFSGSVQAVTVDGANVGDPQSFSGTVPVSGGGDNGGLQWIPVSVSASVLAS